MSETTQLNPNAPTPLAGLADRIKTLHGQVLDNARGVVAKAMACGAALIEAKKQVPHGSWLKWLEDNCGVSERTAEAYMTLARNKPKIDAIIATAANMTLAGALRAIKAPPDPKGSGSLGKYEKAQASLIKKLHSLPPEDIEDAAQRTIAELQEAVAAVKKPMAA